MGSTQKARLRIIPTVFKLFLLLMHDLIYVLVSPVPIVFVTSSGVGTHTVGQGLDRHCVRKAGALQCSRTIPPVQSMQRQ